MQDIKVRTLPYLADYLSRCDYRGHRRGEHEREDQRRWRRQLPALTKAAGANWPAGFFRLGACAAAGASEFGWDRL